MNNESDIFHIKIGLPDPLNKPRAKSLLSAVLRKIAEQSESVGITIASIGGNVPVSTDDKAIEAVRVSQGLNQNVSFNVQGLPSGELEMFQGQISAAIKPYLPS